MKFELSKNNTLKIIDDNGHDLCNTLRVRAFTLEAEVNRKPSVIVELSAPEITTVEDPAVYYSVAGYRAKGLILEDGTLHYFPGFEHLKEKQVLVMAASEKWDDINLPGPTSPPRRLKNCVHVTQDGKSCARCGENINQENQDVS